MKNKILALILAVILVLSCFIIPATAFDANDYGGDSGGDWGGSSSDWGSDSDSDYSDYSGRGGIGGGIVGIVFVIIIILIANSQKKKGGTGSGGVQNASNQGLNIKLPDRTAQIEQIIKTRDATFSMSDFISFAKNVYIDIETAWMKRDMTPVRPVLHDNLYFTTERQVKAKIEQGVIYHYESMVVNTAYATSYAKDAQYEYITIYLNARRIDWQEDEKTGKVLRGDKNTRWDMRYKMKFMRSIAAVTKTETGQAIGHNCPNCGAPMEISSSGQCAYCNSTVTTGQYSWVLSDYGTIRNDTVDEGIRQ